MTTLMNSNKNITGGYINQVVIIHLDRLPGAAASHITGWSARPRSTLSASPAAALTTATLQSTRVVSASRRTASRAPSSTSSNSMRLSVGMDLTPSYSDSARRLRQHQVSCFLFIY